MALVQYTNQSINTMKKLNGAIKTVFGSIAERNEQIQQLLIVSVNEAARVSGEQVTNNLSWLSNIIAVADNTKGVNAKRITRYVVSVLCKDTVTYNSETKQLAKKKSKDIKLSYDVEPVQTWFEFEKAKDKAAAAFDYGQKRITNVVTAALDNEKGNITLSEVLMGVLACESVTVNDLMNAMQAINPIQEVA
tara:strand:+ start:46782 stop:47357 length:576 start_codon:yes stop_codon:yes gene_type:complete